MSMNWTGHGREGAGAFALAAAFFAGLALAADTAAPERPTISPEGTLAEYVVPDVTLLDQHGRSVDLPTLLGGARPVALNFMFTSCRTICPVLTASMAHLRREMGADSGVTYVTITIDPQFDTTRVLQEYAQRHDAGADWTFLTGSPEHIFAVRQGFDAYLGDKSAHRPLTLLRAAGSRHWVRFDTFATVDIMARELRRRTDDKTR